MNKEIAKTLIEKLQKSIPNDIRQNAILRLSKYYHNVEIEIETSNYEYKGHHTADVNGLEVLFVIEATLEYESEEDDYWTPGYLTLKVKNLNVRIVSVIDEDSREVKLLPSAEYTLYDIIEQNINFN